MNENEIEDFDCDDLSDLSEYHDSEEDSESCDAFDGFGRNEKSVSSDKEPEIIDSPLEKPIVTLEEMGMSPIRDDSNADIVQLANNEFEGFFIEKKIIERKEQSETLDISTNSDLEESSNISSEKLANSSVVKAEPEDSDFVGQNCDAIGCTISWLESGDVKRVAINNGVVYELVEFAKKIAWGREYVGEWLLRLRGYDSSITETSNDDLKRINFVFKRRKAIAVTFASSQKSLLRSKLMSFDKENFIIPSESDLEKQFPEISRATFSDATLTPKIEKCSTPKIEIISPAKMHNKASVVKKVETPKKSPTIINYDHILKAMGITDSQTIPTAKFGASIKFASKQGRDDIVGKASLQPKFEVRDNTIGPYCAENNLDVETLNSPSHSISITNGMVFELYIFFKERGATLTSLIHKLYELMQKPLQPYLVNVELGNIQKMVHTSLPKNVHKFLSQKFDFYVQMSTKKTVVSQISSPKKDDLEALTEVDSTVKSPKDDIPLSPKNATLSKEVVTIDIGNESQKSLSVKSDCEVIPSVSEANPNANKLPGKKRGRKSRRGKASLKSVKQSPTTANESSQVNNNLSTEMICDDERKGKITRGDIVNLYCNWVEQKNKDKDSVFVIDLLNEVEKLMLLREVEIVRIPVGMLMTSSVRLFDEYQSYKKDNAEDASSYLEEDWLEDIQCLLSSANKNNPSETNDSKDAPLKSEETTETPPISDLSKNEDKVLSTDRKRLSSDESPQKSKKQKIEESPEKSQVEHEASVSEAISRITFVDLTFTFKIGEIKSVRVSSVEEEKVLEFLTTWIPTDSSSSFKEVWVRESYFPPKCTYLAHFWESNPMKTMKIEKVIKKESGMNLVMWYNYGSHSYLSDVHLKSFETSDTDVKKTVVDVEEKEDDSVECVEVDDECDEMTSEMGQKIDSKAIGENDSDNKMVIDDPEILPDEGSVNQTSDTKDEEEKQVDEAVDTITPETSEEKEDTEMKDVGTSETEKPTDEDVSDLSEALNDALLSYVTPSLYIDNNLNSASDSQSCKVTNKQILDVYDEWRKIDDENKTVYELKKSMKTLMKDNDQEYMFDDCLMGVCFQLYITRKKLKCDKEIEKFDSNDSQKVFSEFKINSKAASSKQRELLTKYGNGDANMNLANVLKSRLYLSEVVKMKCGLDDDIAMLKKQINLVEEKVNGKSNAKMEENLSELKGALKLLEYEKKESNGEIQKLNERLEEDLAKLTKEGVPLY